LEGFEKNQSWPNQGWHLPGDPEKNNNKNPVRAASRPAKLLQNKSLEHYSYTNFLGIF
jgi:hypothetical protein